jgi:uncharacterized protein with NRDE domain
MCLLLFAYECHPRYRLILAANRDEYYDRPTAPAGFWADAPDVLGGRDLECGGTWLGINTQGRVAAVSNYRDPQSKRRGAPSRGLLVSNFLRSKQPPEMYVEEILAQADRYNGFNLIFGNLGGLYYLSNRGARQKLSPGLFGLSNHLLDTPWPKVTRGKQALAELLGNDEELQPEAVFHLLADRNEAPDDSLPDTGVGLEVERILSPLFITSPQYGTRSSTLVLVAREGKVTFIERTFRGQAASHEDVRHEFKITHC